MECVIYKGHATWADPMARRVRPTRLPIQLAHVALEPSPVTRQPSSYRWWVMAVESARMVLEPSVSPRLSVTGDGWHWQADPTATGRWIGPVWRTVRSVHMAQPLKAVNYVVAAVFWMKISHNNTSVLCPTVLPLHVLSVLHMWHLFVKCPAVLFTDNFWCCSAFIKSSEACIAVNSLMCCDRRWGAECSSVCWCW